MAEENKLNDLIGHRGLQIILWSLPQALFLAGIVAGFIEKYTFQNVIWIIALLIMGIACLVNAFRCKRVHCFFSGPFLIGAAVLVFLKSIGLVELHWGWIAGGVLVIGTTMNYLTEWWWGKYF